MDINVCRHVSGLVKVQHQDDPYQPSLLVCEACCHLHDEQVGEGFGRLDAVNGPPLLKGRTLGENLFACKPAGFEIGDPGIPGCLTIYAPSSAGRIPVGSYGIIRQTEQGRMLLYPASPIAWWQQVLGANDVGLIFGLKQVLHPQTHEPVAFPPSVSLAHHLHQQAAAGSLRIKPHLMLRTA